MTAATRTILPIVFTSGLLASFPPLSMAQAAYGKATPGGSPADNWIGTTQVNTYAIPFRLEISGTGDLVQGALINGKEKFLSSSGTYAEGHLVLHFDYYANTIDAAIHDGTLTGTFSGRNRKVPITAELNGKLPVADANAPHIAGVWEVSVNDGAKGELTWKLRVKQTGPNVDAVIERIDGDTGNLYGIWRDGAFVVSHFTAAGPNFAVLRPQPDGTLQLETSAHGGTEQAFPAHRASQLRTVALQSVDDPLHHTSLKNPDEPLTFRFPDLSGKLVSNTDPEFEHKTLIVGIGGSWCPNCQDEAPFFEKLYRKYHSQGLEIVELSFEESSQLSNPVRLRAVIQRYGITYPVLIAGTPDQLSEKFPRVANLNCWPTTFFVGKDGMVKAIHTGYAGPATGKDNRNLEGEMTSQVERLLATKPSATRPKAVQVAQKQ